MIVGKFTLAGYSYETPGGVRTNGLKRADDKLGVRARIELVGLDIHWYFDDGTHWHSAGVGISFLDTDGSTKRTGPTEAELAEAKQIWIKSAIAEYELVRSDE